MPRLKKAQGTHWARLFNGRFDWDYMQGVRAIGLVHNKIGLEPRWYIGGYNFVLGQLVGLAVARYRWRPQQLAEVMTAVNCAVMLDMDLAISVYQEAMLSERQARQEQIGAAIVRFDSQMNAGLAAVSDSANSRNRRSRPPRSPRPRRRRQPTCRRWRARRKSSAPRSGR
jgi:hypothetical protein